MAYNGQPSDTSRKRRGEVKCKEEAVPKPVRGFGKRRESGGPAVNHFGVSVRHNPHDNPPHTTNPRYDKTPCRSGVFSQGVLSFGFCLYHTPFGAYLWL